MLRSIEVYPAFVGLVSTFFILSLHFANGLALARNLRALPFALLESLEIRRDPYIILKETDAKSDFVRKLMEIP